MGMMKKEQLKQGKEPINIEYLWLHPSIGGMPNGSSAPHTL